MNEVLSGCAVRAAIQRFEAEPHFHLCHQCLHIWMHSADDGTGHHCPKCSKGPWKNGWQSYRSAHAEMRRRKDRRTLANLGAAETPLSIEQPHQSKIPTQPQGEGDQSP